MVHGSKDKSVPVIYSKKVLKICLKSFEKGAKIDLKRYKK